MSTQFLGKSFRLHRCHRHFAWKWHKCAQANHNSATFPFLFLPREYNTIRFCECFRRYSIPFEIELSSRKCMSTVAERIERFWNDVGAFKKTTLCVNICLNRREQSHWFSYHFASSRIWISSLSWKLISNRICRWLRYK